MLLKIEEQWQFWILLDLRILKHPENVEFEEDLAEILKVKPLFQLLLLINFLKIIPTKDLVVYTLYMILYKMFYENFDIKATLEKHIN